MMNETNEYQYLIHLLNTALNGTKPEEVPKNICLDTVLEYAKTHEVANIAYIAVKKLTSLSEDTKKRWRQEYLKAVKRDVMHSEAREEILSALHSHGIYTLEVQGTAVKRYYPQSHLRMMSDLDFIIPTEKLDEAKGIMQSIGYETKITHENTEISATKNQVYIELHTEFFDVNQSVYEVINTPFSHTSLHDDYTATVSDTVFYLFHLLHTIKHATEFMGVGIRRIVDLYYLENALKDKADFSYIDGVLKEYNLYDIKTKLIAVKNSWFCGAESNIDISAVEKEILESGSQGVDEIYYRNIFNREREKGKHFVKVRYLFGFILPKKENIYNHYPFCKKHRLPIVLCWIHRWIFSVFNKKKWKNVKTVFSRVKIKMK